MPPSGEQFPVDRAHAQASAKATRAVLYGAAASGLAAYAFQVLGTRGLGETAYAPVSVLWTMQYLIFSVALHPIETFLARLSAQADGETYALMSSVRRSALIVAVLALAATLLTTAAVDALFSGSAALAAATGAVVLAYGGLVIIRGLAAGEGHYRAYALATAGESLFRMAAAVLVLALGGGAVCLAWALPSGAAVVTILGFLRIRRLTQREAPPLLAPDTHDSGPVAFLALNSVVNVSAQSLLAAGPLVVLALGAPASAVSLSFVTLTLARAPMVFGFGGLLSRVLPPLVRRAEAGDTVGLRRAGLSIAVAAGIIASVASLLAAIVGPPAIAAVFGSGLRPPAAFVALAVGAATLAGGNLLLNQVLIARHSEGRLVAPWLLGLMAAVMVIVLSGNLDALDRVAVAMLVGEAFACVLLIAALVSAPALATRSPQASKRLRTVQLD